MTNHLSLARYMRIHIIWRMAVLPFCARLTHGVNTFESLTFSIFASHTYGDGYWMAKSTPWIVRLVVALWIHMYGNAVELPQQNIIRVPICFACRFNKQPCAESNGISIELHVSGHGIHQIGNCFSCLLGVYPYKRIRSGFNIFYSSCMSIFVLQNFWEEKCIHRPHLYRK